MPLQETSGAASYDAFGGNGVPVVPNYIEDVFSTWLHTGNNAAQTIPNGIPLGNSTSGGSAFFDGVSDYVTPPTNSIQFGTSNFTLEFWAFTEAPQKSIFSASATFQSTNVLLFDTSSAVYIGDGNTWSGFINTPGWTTGVWQHHALTRSGSTFRYFINGISQGSLTASISMPTNFWEFGSQTRNSVYFKGELSNLRIVLGTALYTSNFTPSTTPLTAVSGTSLLTFQGTTPFVDNSPNSFTLTNNGAIASTDGPFPIAGTGKGGMVWLKSRNTVFPGNIFDTVRNNGYLTTTATSAINAAGGGVPPASGIFPFNSNGFTLADGLSYWNASGSTYVSWTFARQPKFFDVVTYTGNGLDGRNIAHSLGVTPACIIVKRTDNTSNWSVYHQGNINGSGSGQDTYRLNTTGAGNSLFTVDRTNSEFFNVSFSGAGLDSCNTNGGTYVAYLFASNAGGFGVSGNENVISCGNFTTDGSGNATVNLGYEPQWVMFKNSQISSNWLMLDTTRGWNQSEQDAYLSANLSTNEDVAQFGTPTSTGFQVLNLGTGTFIYIAIRRGPMKVPTTGTSVFSPVSTGSPQATQNTTNFLIDSQWIGVLSGNSPNNFFNDRLRGFSSSQSSSGVYLNSSGTSAEAVDRNTTQYWTNVGFETPQFFANAPSIYWNFRRAPGYFDEVCYTGTGSVANFNHNLAAVPELMIFKRRSGTSPWSVYAAPLGSATFIELNSTNPASVNEAYFNATTPTSSVFTLGNAISVNASGSTFIAYLFTSCPGVSKVGSYTGTGATQVIDCGFTAGARFVLVKTTTVTGDWFVWDSARGIVAGNDPYMRLNSTGAEVTNTDWVDTAASGFELSNAGGNLANSSGETYIFLAIA